MWKKLIGVIAVCGLVAKGQNVTIKNETNDIQRPQLSTMQRILNLGAAYNIPKEESFEDSYKEYRSKNPLAEEVKSKNYPKPYPVGKITEEKYEVENATGIEVVIHDLDISPSKDFLKISPVVENGQRVQGLMFTGQLEKPVKLRLLRTTELKIEFGAGSDQGHKHKGFLLTYAPFGNITEPLLPPTDPIVPFDKLPAYNALLIVPENERKNETWMRFKDLLCESSNKYLAEKKLELETCGNDSVTIKSVLKCPQQWPKSSDCVTLSYSVSLYAEEDDDSVRDPFLEEAKKPAGLSQKQLEEVWAKYGKVAFEKAGFPEYTLPSIKTAVLIWLGVGFGVVLIATILLLAMCRLNTLGGYWPAGDDDKAEIMAHNPEMDIRMFASPDQVIPPLFPAGVGGYTADIYGTERRPTENDALKVNGVEPNGAVNLAFVTDEEILRKRQNFQTFVEGVNRDEAST